MTNHVWAVQVFDPTMGKPVVSLYLFGSLERAERFIRATNEDEHNHMASPIIAAYDWVDYKDV